LSGLVGPASAVSALCLVLLECFWRHIEFPGDPSASAVSRLHSDPIVPADLSSAWRSPLTAMLQRDPAQRPPMRDVLLALRQIVVDGAGRHRSRPAPIPIEETARKRAVRRFAPYARPDNEVLQRVDILDSRVDLSSG